jgi:two-component system, OmpR family, heavy metal sensor histidine kinase CusS
MMFIAWMRRCAAALRSSMTAQIGVSITLISVMLVAGCGYAVMRMTREQLREGGEVLMLANLAFLHEDLAVAQYDVERIGQRLVNRIETQLGSLHVALLDDQRRLLAASDWFDVPLEVLPRSALSTNEIPPGITHRKLRWLQQLYGPLTEVWTTPDGRMYRLLVAEIPVPEGHPRAARGPLAVALALEVTQTRDAVLHGWKVFFGALVASVIAASVLGMLIARRIVIAARRLGTAASRISARALHERLALADAPRELQESGLAFNRMLDRLEGAFKRLSEFSSDLAHDLRTPINNLLGEAQVTLSKPRTAEEYRAVLESAVEDYERISRLIEAMLFIARAEDARASLQCEWIEMRQASERVRDYFEPLADERGITLACELHCKPQAATRVWADKTLLVRAIGNLVTNALHHAAPGSDVRLAATPYDDGACLIEVSNEGPAIEPHEQARIFERLYRIDPSREGSATGSGLGLAIVKSIMDLHGGRATVTSGTGQRTVFGLWFPGPRGADAPAADAAPRSREVAQSLGL